MRGGQPSFCLLLLLFQNALKNGICFNDQSLSPWDESPGNTAIYKQNNSGTRGLDDLPPSREFEEASPIWKLHHLTPSPKPTPFCYATLRIQKIILTCKIGVTNTL